MGVNVRVNVGATSTLYFLEQRYQSYYRDKNTRLQRASFLLFNLARKAITRSRSKYIKIKKAKLFAPNGKPIKNKALTITQFAKGKQITQGHLPGKKETNFKDNVEYVWRGKQGKKTKSTPSRYPGFDFWLIHQIRTSVKDNTIYLYCNAETKGSAQRFLPITLFEKGGTTQWRRNIPLGYMIETITHARTKAGGKRRAHRINYKTPRVAIRKYFSRINRVSRITARPFLAPALNEFMARYFGDIFQPISED